MQPYELAKTVIGTDYLNDKKKGRKQPPVDCFLDFMNKLKEMKSKGEYPENWYDKEIEAVKAILSMEIAGQV